MANDKAKNSDSKSESTNVGRNVGRRSVLTGDEHVPSNSETPPEVKDEQNRLRGLRDPFKTPEESAKEEEERVSREDKALEERSDDHVHFRTSKELAEAKEKANYANIDNPADANKTMAQLMEDK